jgi:hypothetical protein
VAEFKVIPRRLLDGTKEEKRISETAVGPYVEIPSRELECETEMLSTLLQCSIRIL